MNINRDIVYKNYVIFAVLMVIMIAGVLVWILNLRLSDFNKSQQDITNAALTGLEKQVAFFVAEKQRMVSLFVHENIELVTRFANNPDSDQLHDRLGRQLSLYFPDRFSFTIADADGEPLFEDFDGLVSDLCLSDIKQFSSQQQSYHPYIHPNAEEYHFDIMVRYGKGKTSGVFFVSFLADVLGKIIQTIQGPYQKIMLVYPTRNDLIEVIADGARNHISRNDYRLTEKERVAISLRHNIPGTRWQAISFHNNKLYTEFRANLLLQLAVIFMIFSAIAILFVLRLRREERQRELGEEQKKALMSVVTHEFRSPASVIKATLEHIADDLSGEVKGNIQQFLTIALRNTRRMLLLVDDFLDIQKIESGNLQLARKTTRLSTLVVQSTANNQVYAEQFGSTYRLQESLPDNLVYCDENRIEQVLINLLTNAAKYGEEKGVIDVKMAKRKDYLRVSVINSGPGIPEDFRDKVFEKFAMAYAQKNTQKIKSSGLGLSIAKEIVEHHGGRIGFESIPDQTTTFWFELPLVS